MSEKIKRYGKIFALSLLALVLFVGILLTWSTVHSSDYPNDDPPVVDEDLLADTETVLSLLESAQFDDAEILVNTIKTNYAGSVDLPGRLMKIIEKYEKYDIDQAKIMGMDLVNRYPGTAQANEMQFYLDRYAIDELIDSGQLEAAQAAITRFQANHSDQKRLDKNIYQLARQYARQGYFTEAMALNQQLAESYPDSGYVQDAQLRAAQYSIFGLLEAGDMEGAQSAINQMRQNFADHDDLVDVLNEITVRFLDRGEYETVLAMTETYRQAYPSGKNQMQVLMNLASAHIFLNDEAAVQLAVGQLISEFPQEDRGLTNVLFFLSGRYRAQRSYEEERQLFQYVEGNWVSENPTFCQQWVKLYSQIASQKRKDDIDAGIDRLILDYPPNDKLVRYFCWLGNLCHRMGDNERACQLYQVAIDRFPTDTWTLSCHLAQILIDPALNDDERQAAVTQFADTFSGHKHYAAALFRTGYELYLNALQKKTEGPRKGYKEDIHNALWCSELVNNAVYDRAWCVIKQEIVLLKASCQNQLGWDREAIATCRQFLNHWPDYGNRYEIERILAHCSQRLLRHGQIAEEEMASVCNEIETSYQAVWSTAPDVRIRAKALRELGRFYLYTNQPFKAAEHFEYFLAMNVDLNNGVYNTVFALRQTYTQLGFPELAEDVYKEYFMRPRPDAEDIMGTKVRLTQLQGG